MMTDVDKAKVVVDLYRIHAAKFDQTRGIEFKVSISVWTFLALSGFLLVSNKFALDTCKEWLGFVLLSTGTLALHTIWMIGIQKSEDRDSGFMKVCRQKLAELTEEEFEYPPRPWPWVTLEVLFSLFIIVAIGMYCSA